LLDLGFSCAPPRAILDGIEWDAVSPCLTRPGYSVVIGFGRGPLLLWLSYVLSRRKRERWLAQLSNQDMQHDIRNPRIILTIRILLTIGALLTLSGSLMGIYGTITQLEAWQDDPVSVIVAVLLSVLLLVGGGCLLRRGIKYDGHPA
jgi:hypothetical protein